MGACVNTAPPTSRRLSVWRGSSAPGAAGGIGQPLSLLLKLSSRVHTLHLYDVVNTAGVKADVSHINTVARVRLRRLLLC